MKRYRAYGPHDDTLEVFGDVQFQRLDMLADPATLPPGALQVSENLRTDANGITVRGGLARQFLAGTNIGSILFAGLYKPVGEPDQHALVTSRALYLFDPLTQGLARYPFPAGQVFGAADDIHLVQAGIGSDSTLPVLYILHGLNADVLQFDGLVVTVDAAFPKSLFGLAYQNRIAAATGLQELKTSDFLDFATWNLLNQFQIEQGGSDYLVGLLAYQGDYVLIGTRKKWFLAYFDPTLAATGYSGALKNTSFLRLLTNEAGPLGKEAMLESAGFIWFITDAGIFAFQPNLNNELVPLGRPLSAEIQPVFRRISASYAAGAVIAHYGYRMYFAMPISDEPVAVTAIGVVNQVTEGVDLPVDLPALLAEGGVATVTTATPHNLAEDDIVQLSGIVAGSINGEWPVLAVIDELNFSVAIPSATDVILGGKAQAQRIATRNNVIAVLNLNNRDADHPVGMWESIDRLPDGFHADWLRVADYGTQRRLWAMDADNGPALYEEGAVDEVGDIAGGVSLPVDLPVDLSEANFASVPVPGRLVSRAYRWEPDLGAVHGTIAYNRIIRASEVRLTAAAGDTGQVTTRLRRPNNDAVEKTAAFAGGDRADIAVAQRLLGSALEVELEVAVTAGQPTIRALEVQVRRTET